MGDGAAHRIAGVDKIALDVHGTGFEPCHVEEVRDEAREPHRLLLDGGKKVAARGGWHLVAEFPKARDRAHDR